MGYRFCHRCGWLSADEYTIEVPSGEMMCPVHNLPTSGFREDKPDTYEKGYKE